MNTSQFQSQEIDHCFFPKNYSYDIDNLVWAKLEQDDIVTVGITSILASLAGKLNRIKFLKEKDSEILEGKVLASLESDRYFGVFRPPIAGKVIGLNRRLISTPKLANDFPYTDGWFAKIRGPNTEQDIKKLKTIEMCESVMRSQIRLLHIRCFKAFPDYEMFEIGVECSSALAKLNELLGQLPLGHVVHLVSDDTGADLEMIRWSEQYRQSLLEIRKEGNLFHFIVRKAR
jgi:glycine cleavage system H protein